MKFKVNGRELEADQMRVREVCEAEKALGIDLGETGLGGKMAVSLFVAMRRDDPERHAVEIADEVLAVEMAGVEEVEEADPPAAEPAATDGQENGEVPESQRTSGLPRLGASA